MAKIILVLFLSIAFAEASFAEVYKWVDKEGNVHYGDCPPADCKPEKIETVPAPSEEDVRRSKENVDRLIKDQKQRYEARKIKREITQKQAEQRKAELKQWCKTLRSELFLLKQPGIITITDGEGNLIRPTDEERERMIDKKETFIRQNCV
ncbi:MAG: hypothetical protein ACI808_001650 [Paraglaciecola sp.]|jgi:hypothetical protein